MNKIKTQGANQAKVGGDPFAFSLFSVIFREVELKTP